MNIKDIEDILSQTFLKKEFKIKDLSGTGDYIQIDVESDKFIGKTLVEQHKIIYQALGNHLKKDIHAVVINTKVPPKSSL
ncbi:MAG: hypothetical protein CMP11_08420 [Zetaproteobacteria bacterium]|nr:hypothetical protein [Pseudobdellovibrionaceae bacterium]|tara:strand:- start:833 stop:1072 length:240 start_codon:yes stop_codon:yes gene_type:complete